MFHLCRHANVLVQRLVGVYGSGDVPSIISSARRAADWRRVSRKGHFADATTRWRPCTFSPTVRG